MDIEQEIEKNHREAFKIIQFFFSSVDILFIFVFLYLAKFNINPISKLIYVMLIDILQRLTELITYSFKNSFFKEFFLSLFGSCQFFFIISHYNNTLKYLNNNNSQNESENIVYIMQTIVFYLVIFPFEKFNDSNKYYIYKYIIIIICLYFLFKYIINNYKKHLEIVSYKIQQNIFINSILVNMPILSYYSIIIKCVLKLIKLLLSNKLYLSYLDMSIIVFNETFKYAIYLLLTTLLYILVDSDYMTKGIGQYEITVSQNVD